MTHPTMSLSFASPTFFYLLYEKKWMQQPVPSTSAGSSRAKIASGGRPGPRAPVDPVRSTTQPVVDHVIDAPIVKQVSTFNLDETMLYRCCVLFLLLLSVVAIAVAAAGVWNLSDRLHHP